MSLCSNTCMRKTPAAHITYNYHHSFFLACMFNLFIANSGVKCFIDAASYFLVLFCSTGTARPGFFLEHSWQSPSGTTQIMSMSSAIQWCVYRSEKAWAWRCTDSHFHKYTCKRAHTCTRARARAHMHTRTHTHAHKYTLACTQIHTRMHTNTHARLHTNTHYCQAIFDGKIMPCSACPPSHDLLTC